MLWSSQSYLEYEILYIDHICIGKATLETTTSMSTVEEFISSEQDFMTIWFILLRNKLRNTLFLVSFKFIEFSYSKLRKKIPTFQNKDIILFIYWKTLFPSTIEIQKNENNSFSKRFVVFASWHRIAWIIYILESTHCAGTFMAGKEYYGWLQALYIRFEISLWT